MTPLAGITNIVHWADTGGAPSIVRQGRPFAALLGIDRHREIDVLHRIRHLEIGPELLSMDLQQDRAVFRAIPGVPLDGNATHPAILARSLTVLSRLHRQPAYGTPFSASSLIRHYLTIAPIPRELRNFCERQAERSAQLEQSAELALCHNDCLAKNWILTPDADLKLIDFEFAAPNDPAFDLATWCLAFHVDPADPLLDSYARSEPQFTNRVRTYVPVVDALWTLYCHIMGPRLSGEAHTQVAAQMTTRTARINCARATPGTPR